MANGGSGTRRHGETRHGTVVMTLDAMPGIPVIDVIRFDGRASVALPGIHTHAFLALAYFERDGGSLASGRSEMRLEAGDVVIAAPGEVYDPSGLADAFGWAVFFAPTVVAPDADRAVLSWASHPLLFPFATSANVAPRRLRVPPAARQWWATRYAEMHDELEARAEGFGDAVLANLTLLLVSMTRLASADLPNDFRDNGEPLLAEVFETIERQYQESASLRTVAEAVHLTPGHLTTVVRRKTGRTVQAWIAERRMVEARRLLAETDLSVEEVGRRSGLPDAGYFVRSFKRAHAVTPLRWRRAARPQREVTSSRPRASRRSRS